MKNTVSQFHDLYSSITAQEQGFFIKWLILYRQGCSLWSAAPAERSGNWASPWNVTPTPHFSWDPEQKQMLFRWCYVLQQAVKQLTCQTGFPQSTVYSSTVLIFKLWVDWCFSKRARVAAAVYGVSTNTCVITKTWTHFSFSKQQHADHGEEAEVQSQQQYNTATTGKYTDTPWLGLEQAQKTHR